MSGEDDVLLGRLALSAGLVTRERLDECMQLLAAAPGRTLAEIFTEKRYLTDQQVSLLRAIQGEAANVKAASSPAVPAVPSTPAPPPTQPPSSVPTPTRKPNLFGKLVLMKRWATASQVDNCLDELEALERRGVQKQLGEIMVGRGLLTTAQVTELLAEQDRSIVKCDGCGAKYNFLGADPTRELKCPKCGASLANPKRLTNPGVEAMLYKDGTASDVLLGKTMGGCKILQRLGRGGMATVYKGKHVGLNKFMAVKILPPASARTQTMLDRFIKEARAAAKIEHPNIVQVYDVDCQDGYNFILMQFVEGESVADILARDGKMDEDKAIDIIRECAKGLDAAHKASLVHRDIKPDNIMITTKGEVKLADFGLAQEVQSGKPGTTVVAGTPYYMSPEQWDGRNVDARSDLYSLGITFYLMLTGKRPFDGASPLELMKAHAMGKPRSPRKIVDTLGEGVCAIIGKLMAKEPKLRYQSADELLKEFDRMSQGLDPLAMKSMTGKTVECPFCSTLNPEKAKKCSVCGEYLFEQKDVEVLLLDDEMLCPKCKSVQRKGTESCSECGAAYCRRCKVKLAVKQGYCSACADFRTRVTKPQ